MKFILLTFFAIGAVCLVFGTWKLIRNEGPWGLGFLPYYAMWLACWSIACFLTIILLVVLP